MSHVASSILQASNGYPSGASVSHRSFKLSMFCRCSRPRIPPSPYWPYFWLSRRHVMIFSYLGQLGLTLLWLTFLDNFNGRLFSYPIVGKLSPTFNSTLMRRGRRVMVWFLVLIGFMTHGLDRGIASMLFVSNSFPLNLQNKYGGALCPTNVLSFTLPNIPSSWPFYALWSFVVYGTTLSLKHVTCQVFKTAVPILSPVFR